MVYVNHEELKRRTRSYYEEVLGRGNMSLIDLLYADRIRVSDDECVSREQFKALVGRSITVFRDLAVQVRDQVAEGDRVVTRWTATGTQAGAFLGLPPGTRVEVSAIHIHQFVDGRIAARWEEISSTRAPRGAGAVT